MRMIGWTVGSLALSLAAAPPVAGQVAAPAPASPPAPADVSDRQADSVPADITLPRGDDAPPPVLMRVQIGTGPQWQPWYPGDDRRRLSPWFSLSRTRADKPFDFGAADDGTNLTLFHTGRTELAIAARFEGRRRFGDLVPGLPGVGRTLETGVSVETWIGDNVRWRGDVRKGLNGHRGWISQLGLDYVRRDADHWVLALGPRVLLADARYQRAWFGVSDEAAVATGRPAYRPGGGVKSVAATGSAFYALTPRWAVEAQLGYERLVGDAARSPIMRADSSRNQMTVAVGLDYTFTVRVPDRGIFRLIR